MAKHNGHLSVAERKAMEVDERLRLESALNEAQARALQLSPEQQAAIDDLRRKREEREAELRRATSLAGLAVSLGDRYSQDRVAPGTYKVYDDRQKPVVKRLKVVAEDIRSYVERGINIALFGTVGTGKDHLLAALLYHAANSCISCQFVRGQELFARLKATMDRKAKETEEKVFVDLLAPQVLGISDCFAVGGELRPWRQEVLYRLIDSRYRTLKPTWITGNVMNADEADRELTEPVWDRLQEMAEVFFCEWPSYRERLGKK